MWCLPGCSDRRLPPRASLAAPSAVSALRVMMINGGGTPSQNYQSHLLHVQELTRLLLAAGVGRDQIAIFSGDGDDPAADVATRETQPEEGFWLLEGTRLEGRLRTPVTTVSSAVDGIALRPATRLALEEWFIAEGSQLRPGDTLLLYVTDHGTRTPGDPDNNRITLWGPNESLPVRDLRTWLEGLPPGVRVVMLMSQCYSGGFASLLAARGAAGMPSGLLCGYFSSTADRPAYGCYPENRGIDNVGHSFQFLQGLASAGGLADAHLQVLVNDDSPDVPLRTSDVYLEQLLLRAAAATKVDAPAMVDDLLREAWRDRGAWEPDIRLLDRIGHAFGIFSPRLLSELDEQGTRLTNASEQLESYGKAWKNALGDTTQANLERFVAADADWRAKLDDGALRRLDQPALRALTVALLDDLERFTRRDGTIERRLHVLADRRTLAGAARYRMEVRLGVVLRMRALLTNIAGRTYLATRGTDAERAAFAALRDCEDLRLPIPSQVEPIVDRSEPFPALEDDVRLAQSILPGWMGINFREAPEKQRAQLGVGEGAATVVHVYPESPAKAAGLEPGDVVLGPPGDPFRQKNQIRSWVMLSEIDRPLPLRVLREGRPLEVALVPKPFPTKWPELPGPPKVGSAAPVLGLETYRGTVPTRLAGGRPHLLFFWATWCLPCKASLPELLAFERERSVPVVAITDEPAETLSSFLQAFHDPFPASIAIDQSRRAFVAYGVSGTPTFVLVGGDGSIRSYASGYSAARGLGIDGWQWAGRPRR